MFVKLIHEIKKRNLSVTGMIIGDVITDADREYKAGIIAYIHDNEMDSDVYIPGFRQYVADILAATDCVVVPSSEGLGLVAMEAMCAKTKVAAINKGGSAELIKAADCGEMYAADGSEIDIADAVLKAIKQSDDRVENGYEFCKCHNYSNYGKSLQEVFDCAR